MRSKGKRKQKRNLLVKYLGLFLFFILIINANISPFIFGNPETSRKTNNREPHDPLTPNLCAGNAFHCYYSNNKLYSLLGGYFYAFQTEDHRRYQDIANFYFNDSQFSFMSISGNSDYIFSLARINHTNQFMVIDPNNLTKSNFISSLINWRIKQVKVEGNYAYILEESTESSGSNLLVYDITNPYNPILDQNLTFSYIPYYFVKDRCLYYINNISELRIHCFDPYIIGSYDLGNITISKLAIHENRIYIVNKGDYESQTSGFDVIDVTNKNNPELLYHSELSEVIGYESSISIRNNYAYIAQHHELFAFDLNDLPNVVMKDSFEFSILNYPGGFSKTFTVGDILYATVGGDCWDTEPIFLTFDISDPGKLKRLAPVNFKRLTDMTRCWLIIGGIGAIVVFILTPIFIIRNRKKKESNKAFDSI